MAKTLTAETFRERLSGRAAVLKTLLEDLTTAREILMTFDGQIIDKKTQTMMKALFTESRLCVSLAFYEGGSASAPWWNRKEPEGTKLMEIRYKYTGPGADIHTVSQATFSRYRIPQSGVLSVSDLFKAGKKHEELLQEELRRLNSELQNVDGLFKDHNQKRDRILMEMKDLLSPLSEEALASLGSSFGVNVGINEVVFLLPERLSEEFPDVKMKEDVPAA